MPVYKRGDSTVWWIRIGRDVNRSSGTRSKAEAQRLEAKWRQELWRVKHMGEQPRRTWAEAALRWWDDVGEHRRGSETDHYRLTWITEQLEREWLEDVTRERVEAVLAARGIQAPATYNHYLDLIRAVLRYAQRELRWIEHVPTFRRREVDNARVRYLKDWDEAERLISAMPPHWQDPARFTLMTGLRQGTLRAAEKDWIHRGVLHIPAAFTKSKRRLVLPLTDDAQEVAKRQPDGVRLFTRPDGEPLPKMHHKVWKRVLAKAAIRDFRWHDLRHTWASWAVMSGVSLYELQQLGDWSTHVMVQRYSHLSPDHLREAIAKMNRSTSVAHHPENPPNLGGSDTESGA